MKWKVFFGFSLVFLLAFLFSFLTQLKNDTFALTESYTFSSMTQYSFPISSFTYGQIIFDTVPTQNVNLNVHLPIDDNCSSFSDLTIVRTRSISSVIFSLPSEAAICSSSSLLINNWPFSGTLILTDSSPSFDSFTPSGTYDISSNGIYDISSYSSVNVNVPETVIQGDYHNDLVNIYNAIILCGGVILVLYFFYCIYRIFIKTIGG